ncbi:MAG: hypothetical protein NTW87_28155 [Planctomycetota bacterium]|nr:hypothetical protein [Planctomycetota bacterium]
MAEPLEQVDPAPLAQGQAPSQPAKPTRHRLRVALAIAAATDLTQVVLLPLFAEGALSPLQDALDVVVAITLTTLLGWHWVFLPSFLAELVPGVDLAPTWTAAVAWVMLRQKKDPPADQPPQPNAVPPGPR